MKRAFILVIQLCMLVHVAAQDGKELGRINEKNIDDNLLSTWQIILKAKEIGKQDTTSANKLFRKAIAEAINTNDFEIAGKAYYEMGEMYFLHKNHNKSFGAFRNARANFKLKGSTGDMAFTVFALGRQQYYRGNYKMAAEHLKEALTMAREQNLLKLESNALEYLGLLYHLIPGSGESGNDLLNKSLNVREVLNDPHELLTIYIRLSDVYFERKKFDSSLISINQAFALANKLRLKYEITFCRLYQVTPLLRLNRIPEAGQKLDSIRKHSLDLKDMNTSIRYFTFKGNYFLALKDTVQANNNYGQALQIAAKEEFPEMYALVYKNMADAFYYAGDLKKAYQYSVIYNSQIASLFSNDNQAILDELDHIFKAKLTEGEVKYLNAQNKLKELKLLNEAELKRNLQEENLLKDSLLTKERIATEALERENIYKNSKLETEKVLSQTLSSENELNSLQLKNERKWRVFLLISAFGFLLSAASVFYLYKKQKKKTAIIEKQGEELKILMKEIHHRVKNNLQVISSLLDLQTHTIKDDQAATAVREGRNRVQSMALIHQNLYHEGNLREIAMKDYIINLAKNLFDSYNIQEGKIILKTEVEDLTLDIETVIPLGLILNELISNSLKYAFVNRRNGEILVSLSINKEQLKLKVGDNGQGFPPGTDTAHSGSFGMRMVRAFAQKLKADLSVYNDMGACVVMTINKYKTTTGIS